MNKFSRLILSRLLQRYWFCGGIFDAHQTAENNDDKRFVVQREKEMAFWCFGLYNTNDSYRKKLQSCQDQESTVAISQEEWFTGIHENLFQCRMKGRDECQSNPCHPGGQCINGVNGYECECRAGYTGTNCQTNIDECHSNPCPSGRVCNDGLNGYECECKAGYTGSNCQTDINECASHPCYPYGTCVDIVNGYECKCKLGYTGTHCRTDMNDCFSRPCLNEGECWDREVGYVCHCDFTAGFTGSNCEIPPKDCGDIKEKNPKKGNGVYVINPPGHHRISVYCDMNTMGGGWTVFQRRMNGKENFRRNWTDYKQGFGDVSKEHWLGNDALHSLTRRTQELLVELREVNRSCLLSAWYRSFHVSNEGGSYKLDLGNSLACNPQCVLPRMRGCARNGHTDCKKHDAYRGNKSTTVTGKTCQRWDSQYPHKPRRNFLNNSDGFPDGNIHHNYCRNPIGAPGPWCYTTDPDTRWELCFRDCWDSLSYHHGTNFSTVDKDHDGTTKNCAEKRNGGWWYTGWLCEYANLNGLYHSGCVEEVGYVNWAEAHGWYYSFQQTEMKIRPTDFMQENRIQCQYIPFPL